MKYSLRSLVIGVIIAPPFFAAVIATGRAMIYPAPKEKDLHKVLEEYERRWKGTKTHHGLI